MESHLPALLFHSLAMDALLPRYEGARAYVPVFFFSDKQNRYCESMTSTVASITV
jgi:hypothetical protein